LPVVKRENENLYCTISTKEEMIANLEKTSALIKTIPV